MIREPGAQMRFRNGVVNLIFRGSHRMNKPVAAIFLLVGLSASPVAQDVTTLEKIGPVVSFTKTDKAVAFSCRDNSQVQVTILASDLIRVRASFARPMPTRDHSWAI